MKELLKVLGPIIVLLGVLFLVIYYFAVQTNTLLVLGGVSMVVGLVAHIFINKYIKE